MIENNQCFANAQLSHSFRHPRTPERDRQSEREQDHLQHLQMTSPSVRRQREYNRQEPIPQPNFGGPVNMGPMAAAGPYAPVQQRVNWQESLAQGFQARHAQRLQNRGGRRQRQTEGTPMAAGPSAPIEGRVNRQERVEQDFEARHNQQLQNHGGSRQDQNHGGFIAPQQFIGRQE